MKICYNCFHEGNDQEKYCQKCGYSLIETTDSKYPQALPCGSVLFGKYIVGRVLGQGGFGITYIAQDYNNKQLLAIKEYFPGTTATRTGTRSVQAYNVQNRDDFAFGKNIFLKEATTLSKFTGNPNIVRVYQFFEENETAYFVMEYVDGESLKNYVRRKGGILQWQEAMNILLPVMDALEAVHKEGIIHRDISPDNIAISKDGTVKLLDFGAARYSMGEKSQSLSVVLKHGFAPAEQYSRHGNQGPWTDVYALAATMYNIITGRMVPDSIDRIQTDTLRLPSSFGIEIPASVEEVLKKALAVNSEDRFRTMGEFKKALVLAASSLRPVSNDPAEVPGGIGSRTSFPDGSNGGSTGNDPVSGTAGNAGGIAAETGGSGDANAVNTGGSASEGNGSGGTVSAGSGGKENKGRNKPDHNKLAMMIAAAVIVIFLLGKVFSSSGGGDKNNNNTTNTTNTTAQSTDLSGSKDNSGTKNDAADGKDNGTDAKNQDAGNDTNNIGLTAELPTEDQAIAYVKGILDIMCTGTFDTSSVSFSDINEEDAEGLQNLVIEGVISSLEGDYTLQDDSKELIKTTMLKALSKCSYSVEKAEKTGDGEYNVYVSIKPLRFLYGVQEKLIDNLSNMDASEVGGMSEEELQLFILHKTFELVAEGLDDPTYDPAEEVVVAYTLLDPEENLYGLTETEIVKLGEKLFSYTTEDGSLSTGTESGSAGVSTDDGGMSSGNYYNRGYFAFRGDVCYFSSGSKLYRSGDSSLKDPEYLADGFGDAYINIEGNYIYHLVTYKNAICRCDLDGTNEVIVFDGSKNSGYSPASLYIHGGWCYFSNDRNLYRISLDRLNNTNAGAAEEAECIAKDFNYINDVYPSLCIVGEKLYYNGEGGLTCIEPDGSNRKVISDKNGHLISDGTSIISQYGTRWINRIEQDGTATEILELQSSEGSIRGINLADGWIYYVLETDSKYELWKMKLDGTDRGYVNDIGSKDQHVISMNTFPGKDCAYFYILKNENDSLTPISKCVELK